MSLSPLYDIYDPTGVIRQGVENEVEYDELGRPKKRRARLADLMPEEEQSGLLESLAQAGTSGLATAGYVFDTPGSAVRGFLVGKPTSVLGSSDDRVTGRDLLRHYGLIGQKDTWTNFVWGLAAEFLTDPLTYGTFGLSALLGKGAKTGSGLASEAAGLLRNSKLDAADAGKGVREWMRSTTPSDLLQNISDPAARSEAERVLRSQFERFGVGPEGMDQAVGAFDTLRFPGTNMRYSYDLGKVGDAVAKFGDKAGDWARTAPGIGHATTWLSSAFDSRAGEYYNPHDLELTNQIQDSSRRMWRTVEDDLYAKRMRLAELQRTATDARVPDVFPQSAGSLAGQEIPEHLRSFQNVKLRQAMADWVEGGGTSGDAMADWVLDNVDEFSRVRDAFADLGPSANTAAKEVGLSPVEWQSLHGTGWFPRQMKWWQDPKPPAVPGASTSKPSAWSRAERVLGVVDNFGRRRNMAYDLPGGNRTFRELTSGPNARQLQQDLIAASDDKVPQILNRALQQLGIADPYQPYLDNLLNSKKYMSATPEAQAALERAANSKVRQAYIDLADLLRRADQQFVDTGTGIFDSDPWANMVRYTEGQSRNTAAAKELMRQLFEGAVDTPARDIVGGATVSLAKAAQDLGFDKKAFSDLWKAEKGAAVGQYSVPEKLYEALKVLAPKTRLAMPESYLLGALDNVTNAFKTQALASPSFHTRNTYSGWINAMTHGAFNPLDWWAALRGSAGNYDAIARRLEGAPGFVEDAFGAPMTAQDRIAKYLDLTGATQVTGTNQIDDAGGAAEQALRGMYLGADKQSIASKVANAAYQPDRSWRDWLRDMTSMRGVGILQTPRANNTNPLLVLNDAVGSRAEDALRGGVFLNQLRKGVDPRRAADVSFLSNVDYRPQAFTNFERGLKRVVPFYSFQKGILPSIATNIIERPGGLQQNIIRATVRGTEPGENNFLPVDMRRSSAIALPEALSSGNPDLKRYLTGTDLPWEWLFNLATPGTGATPWSRAAGTLQNIGSNLLGMTNPLIKAPLEFATNRQLYSGRELSDLYSVLERDLGPVGRPLEQLAVNFLPFGSRALSTYRQLTDERLSGSDAAAKAAWNLLAGAKIKDIDAAQAKERAARDMMKDILQTTPGAHSFENVAISEEDLAKLPPDQQRVYLLYKILQSQQASRARTQPTDPLQLLGLA